MKQPIAESRYNRNNVDPGIKCTAAECMTKQSFKDECDLNLILQKYSQTGQLPSNMKENPQYGDYSNNLTYDAALNLVQNAQNSFYSLDAKVRARFFNDPSNFLAFTANPDNIPEMVSLGLATMREPLKTEPSPTAEVPK